MKWEEKAKLFGRYDIPVVKTRVFDSHKEASKDFEDFKKPVVVKSELTGLGHRTEEGKVVTGIKTKKELKEAFKKVKNDDRVLIQEQLEGREIIIGGKVNPTFGPVVMFGLGGIFTEVYEDVAFRAAPIGEKEAEKMMKETKGYKILGEFRGREEADIPLVRKTMVNVSKMMAKEDIETLDINPLIVNKKTGAAVDIKLELKS